MLVVNVEMKRLTEPIYIAADKLFELWHQDVLNGPAPTTWNLGSPFGHVGVGPGGIVLLGGPPAAGKTALLMQWVFTALLLNANLRVTVANVEMAPARLLDRQLARLSGVPLGRILRRQYEPTDQFKLTKGFARIRALASRLAFVQGPYDLARVADVADEFEADLLVLDYLQRFDVPGRHNGLREKTNALMSTMRQLASAGVGILAAAALTRSKDSAGRSSYSGAHLNMASFRESSELEYGRDNAFLLFPVADDEKEEDDSIQRMMLAHVKSRDGELTSTTLKFHRRIQKFTALDDGTPAPSAAAAVNQVWQGKSPEEVATDGESDEQQGDESE
jgi:replicative DNA helicase